MVVGRMPALAVGLAAALAVAGCGSEAGGVVPVARPPQSEPTPTAPPEPPQAPPSLEGLDPDPAAAEAFQESLGVPPKALEPAVDPPAVARLALENTARGSVSTEPREILGAELAEGERASRRIAIAGGKCVTVAGQGGLGIIEIDLFLTQPLDDGAPAVIAQDADAGPVAVMAGGSGCVRAPAGGLEAEVHAVARRGEGLVLVAVYER